MRARDKDKTVATHLAAEAARVRRGQDLARRINAEEPTWDVDFSVVGRQFVAIPLWNPGEPVVLRDPDPHGLWFQMRQLEQSAHPQAPPHPQSPSNNGRAVE